ncbi:MAG: DUF2769 domain-containing protein [Candidatus Hodarchaeota archaeon]
MSDIEERWKTATFEEKYKAMMTSMSEAEQKRGVEQVNYMCLCNRCPTYIRSRETTVGFCSTKKSESIQTQKGCLCSTCPVTKTMSLRWEYYCTQGSALDLSDL